MLPINAHTNYIIYYVVFTNGLKHNLDINECDMDPCNVNADCTDTSGSFECTCRRGYSGDGFTCDGMLR